MNPIWLKAPSYLAAVPISQGQSIPTVIAMSETHHTATRKAVGRAFTTTTLLDYESAIEQTGQALLQALSNSPVVDATSVFQFFAMDVLVRIAFSESLCLLEKGRDIDGVLEAVIARFDHWNRWAAVPFLDNLINRGTIARFRSATHSPLARVGLARLRARQKNDPETWSGNEDLLAKFMLGQEKYPENFTEREVLGTIMSTIGAGADTTGGTLTYTCYLLGKHPAVCGRLENEIQLAIGDGALSNPPKWNQVLRMPYLEAVLKESMRYISIAAWGLDRVVPKGGCTIANQFIPQGTIVGCQIDAIHRDPNVFGEDADDFRPERWIEATEEQRKQMDRCFLAFGSDGTAQSLPRRAERHKNKRSQIPTADYDEVQGEAHDADDGHL